jgi:hypothetical protein
MVYIQVVSHHRLDGSSYQIVPMIRHLQSIIFNETDYKRENP